MADTLANTFDVAKGYRKVIFQQKKPVMDYELNELQDIIRYDTDQLVSKLAGSLNLIGGSGAVTPSGTTHSVDVEGGIGVQADELVRIPAVTGLQIFASGSTGTQTATVYVEWWDDEIDSTEDPDLLGDTHSTDTFGESAVRTKRNVDVLYVSGTALPAPAAGHSQFKIATVVHDFAADGNTVLQSDINQEAGVAGGAWRIEDGKLRTNETVNVGTLEVTDITAGTIGATGNVSAGGSLKWGGGAAITSSDDVAEKDEANVFTEAQTVRRSVVGYGLSVGVTGETDVRWRVSRTGTLEMGDGSGAFDTNLYRSAANTLKTDDDFVVGGTSQLVGNVGIGTSSDSAQALRARATGLSGPIQYGVASLSVFTSGATSWGRSIWGRVDTAAATFTMADASAFYAANAVKGTGSAITTQYGLYVERLTAGSTNYAIYTEGSTPSYFGGALTVAGDTTLSSGNKLRLDGSTSGDTYLWEAAANSLRLVVGGTAVLNLTTAINANAPIQPGATSTYELGTNALRWSTIYGASADLTGELTVGGTSTLTGNVGIGASSVAAVAVNVAGTLNAGTSQYGIRSWVTHGSGTTASARGVDALILTADAAFTMADAYTVYIRNAEKGTGSAITTQYGLYVESLTAGTNNYAIYTAGSTPSYFGGDVKLQQGKAFVLDGLSGNDYIAQIGAGSIGFATGAVERMRINPSGNIGIGTTDIEAWATGVIGVELGQGGAVAAYSSGADGLWVMSNAYFDGAWKYKRTDPATRHAHVNGTHTFEVAPDPGVGGADTAITWTTALTISNNGHAAFGSNVYVPTKVALTGGARLQLENASGDDSAYIQNVGPTGSSSIKIADTLYVQESGAIYPATNGAHDNGISTNRWATMYGRALNLGGIDSPNIVLASSSSPTVYRTDLQNVYSTTNPMRLLWNDKQVIAVTRWDGSTWDIGIGDGASKTVIGSNLVTKNITFKDDQVAYLLKTPTYGGAIRFRGNADTSTDRDLQFGQVNNSGVFASWMTLTTGSGYLLINRSDNPNTRRVAVNGDLEATAVYETSTREAKTNIRVFEWGGKSALEYVDEIEIVRFNYREGWSEETDVEMLSFIAEDTDPLFSGKRQKSFATKNVVSLLVKSTQELHDELRVEKARNKSLRAEVATCKLAVESIEERLAAAGI